LRPKTEPLQEGNNIVTETQQLDNVTNVTEETDNDTEIKATEQPTTNETIPTEQIVEEDKTDVKAEDKGVEEDLKTDVAKTETTQVEITIDNFMDSINENDIDFKKAESAYRAVSFDPDKRAKSIQKDYVNTVKRVYDELLPLAKTEEQKTVLLEEMQKFKENYLKKQNAVIEATSRTMSSMITGPANFPVARNQKALDTEHKRMVEFSEWLEKSVPAIKKKLDSTKPATDKFDDRVKEIKDRVDRTIEILVSIKNGSPYNPALIRSNLKSYI